MPKYKVDTDQGSFVVELDQAPTDLNQLKSLVGGYLGADSPNLGGVSDDMAAVTANAAQNNLSLAQSEKQLMSPEQFTKERQRSATQTPGFQRAAGAVIPTLATAAGFIPGMQGLLPSVLLGAGGTAANQALGFEDYDPKQIALGGTVGALGPAVVGGTKGALKAAGKFVNPGATRAAGVEAGMEKMGAVPNTIDRAYSIPGSKAAYAAAEAQPPLPIGAMTGVLDDVAAKSGKAIPNKPALKQLKATRENLSPPIVEPEVEGATNMEAFLANKARAADAKIAQLAAQPTEVAYKEIMQEVQGLRTQANMAYRKGNNVSGTTLNNAAMALLDKMDSINPAIKKANAMYRREQSTEKISKVLSNPRPDVKLSQLLIEDPLVQGAIPKKEAKFLESIADQIATMGTQASPYSGVAAKSLNLIATPVAAAMGSPTGRFLLRQTFKDGKVTEAGLATIAQFMRAYQAQGGDKD